MPDQMIQWIVGQSGTAGVAVLALFMLRQAYEDRDKKRMETIEEERARTNMLIEVVKENTRASALLTAAVTQVSTVMANCVLAQEGGRLKA